MLFEDDVNADIHTWLNGVPLAENVGPQRIQCRDEHEWLSQRRFGIGASEVGVIVGASSYTSPYALWWRKKLDWRLPQTEGQRWGHLVEDPIAALFAEEMTDSLYIAKPAGHPYSLWCHPVRRWVMCTPDRLAVDRAGHVHPVEVKSDEGGDGWGEPGGPDVPRQYRCQALWQAYIFNSTGTFVVRKRGSGKRRMVWYWVPIDLDELGELVTSAESFLSSVAGDIPPPPDGGKATTDALKELHAVQEETFADVPADLYTEWSAARAAKREATAREALASNRMRAAMGTAQFATVRSADGFDVIRVKRRVGKRAGYEVAPAVTDELREVGNGQQPQSPDVPRHGHQADSEATAAASEEGAGRPGGEGAEMGTGTTGTPGGTDPEGFEGLVVPPTEDNPYGLPPELARLVDLGEVDVHLIQRNPNADNDCGA